MSEALEKALAALDDTVAGEPTNDGFGYAQFRARGYGATEEQIAAAIERGELRRAGYRPVEEMIAEAHDILRKYAPEGWKSRDEVLKFMDVSPELDEGQSLHRFTFASGFREALLWLQAKSEWWS
jgi:hypothetical protein